LAGFDRRHGEAAKHIAVSEPSWNMYRHLTLSRLRWYALATGRVLVRHWQGFVLAGALVPGGMPVGKLLMGLGYPLLAALHVGHEGIHQVLPADVSERRT
jgi:hypothetical protein